MFDTMKVAKRIREARIARNMTQLALADAMAVSYQAVSNWERGNSLPDISKLEQLCQVLNLRLDDLLGVENKATAVVTKVLREEEPALTMEELGEVAPMLPPDQVRKQAQSAAKQEEPVDLSVLSEIAPFLDDAYLDALVENIRVDSVEGLEDLAPFLSENALDKLAAKATPEQLSQLVSLAPFLSEKSLDDLARRCQDAGDISTIEELAPFLSEETLDTLVERTPGPGNGDDLSDLYPFLGDRTLRKIADRLLKDKNLKALREIAPFL